MNKGNFTAKDNFPVSTFTYDFLQQMAHLAGKLAQLGGQNYILSGCVVTGTTASAGLIVINGEVLPFEAGTKKTKVTIQEIRETDHFNGIDYPESYIHRVAKFADNGEYDWSTFKQIPTNEELKKQINALRGDPPGKKIDWTGRIDRIPDNYLPADGRVLKTVDYPDLAWFYGKENDESFRLPDLRKKFIVGWDGVEGSDYGEIGNTGGEEKHKLTENEIPAHKHIIPWGENPTTAWNPQWGYAPAPYNENMRGSNSNDNDNSWAYTSPTGGGIEHENRPPFYVLAFLIKVKY